MAALLDSLVDFRTGLKGQIGIAGEHQASKVRTGAVGRGAALPASVRRMLEGWIPIWPLRRWKTKWSSYLGPAARIAASDVRAATRATVAASSGTPMNRATRAISRSGCARSVS